MCYKEQICSQFCEVMLTLIKTKIHKIANSFSDSRVLSQTILVPALYQTLSRHLDSLEPFLREDEQQRGTSFSSAHAMREKWADEFEFGIVGTIQERLLGLFT